MSLAKVLNAGGGARPQRPPPVAPMNPLKNYCKVCCLINELNSFISNPIIPTSLYFIAGPQLANFERRYIYNGKDEIKHGLSPSVKSVAPI